MLTKEAPSNTRDTGELNERTRILPVTEAKTIMAWSSSEIDYDTEDLGFKSGESAEVSHGIIA